MQSIMTKLQKLKKIGIIGVLLILTFIAGNSTLSSAKDQVSPEKILSAHTQVVPSPTLSPLPTTTPITIVNNIILPTQVPAVITVRPTPTTQMPTPTLTTAQVFVTPISTPTPTVPSIDVPSVSPIPWITSGFTATPTPTQVSQNVEIDIDYAGEHATSTYTVAITPGETAWQVVQDALSLPNLQYTDYGGDLGIFITGFNGVHAASNQYYDFLVNGTSSNVGVSSYIVNNHDVLKFVLSSF